MNTCDVKISIKIDNKGNCEFIDVPDYWHRCKLSRKQVNAIMKILKKSEEAKENENTEHI